MSDIKAIQMAVKQFSVKRILIIKFVTISTLPTAIKNKLIYTQFNFKLITYTVTRFYIQKTQENLT